jgi:hypothetical protein
VKLLSCVIGVEGSGLEFGELFRSETFARSYLEQRCDRMEELSASSRVLEERLGCWWRRLWILVCSSDVLCGFQGLSLAVCHGFEMRNLVGFAEF